MCDDRKKEPASVFSTSHYRRETKPILIKPSNPGKGGKSSGVLILGLTCRYLRNLYEYDNILWLFFHIHYNSNVSLNLPIKHTWERTWSPALLKSLKRKKTQKNSNLLYRATWKSRGEESQWNLQKGASTGVNNLFRYWERQEQMLLQTAGEFCFLPPKTCHLITCHS